MAIALYRDVALSEKFSSGGTPGQPGYLGLFEDEASFDATAGEEVFRVAYVADDTAQTKHYRYAGAQLRVQAGQTVDINSDGRKDVELYAAKPVETAQTDNFTGDGTRTEFTLTRKFVKPGSESITVGGAQTRNTHYGINYLNGVVKFASAPANGAAVVVTYTHGDDGTGAVNKPSNSAMKANGDQKAVALWDVPERSGGLKGTTPDGVPVVLLAVVKPDSLARAQQYTLSQARAEVRGLLTDGAY